MFPSLVLGAVLSAYRLPIYNPALDSGFYVAIRAQQGSFFPLAFLFLQMEVKNNLLLRPLLIATVHVL